MERETPASERDTPVVDMASDGTVGSRREGRCQLQCISFEVRHF